jgi:hypothetical protein
MQGGLGREIGLNSFFDALTELPSREGAPGRLDGASGFPFPSNIPDLWECWGVTTSATRPIFHLTPFLAALDLAEVVDV